MNNNEMDTYKLPNSFVAYDLETSDFMNGGGEMVEIGAVRFVDGEPDERFSELCALEGRMNPKATEVNHITDEMLEGCRPRAEVFADFCHFVGGLPLVGFNNHDFDDPFVDREAERTGLGSPVANGSHDVRVLLGGRGSLAKWCRELRLVNDEAHRAWSDAEVTGRIFVDIRTRRLGVFDGRQVASTGVIDDLLAGQVICFTGTTDDYPKRACQTLALAHGAAVSSGVTKKITMLVNLEGRRSGKVAKAEKYVAAGCGIEIVDVKEFLSLVGHPGYGPVLFDVLQTGAWASELKDEIALMVRRELDLPVTKQLVYLQKNGFETVVERNGYGVEVPVSVPVVETLPVRDLRVVEACGECGTVTLEILVGDEAEPRRVLAPYLKVMQNGKDYYLAKTSGAEIEE